MLFFSEDIYENEEFVLPLSRVELGNFVDTSRESVCRILTELSNDKLIELHGKRIKILNKKSLVTLSAFG